jgi:hypothetical protein
MLSNRLVSYMVNHTIICFLYNLKVKIKIFGIFLKVLRVFELQIRILTTSSELRIRSDPDVSDLDLNPLRFCPWPPNQSPWYMNPPHINFGGARAGSAPESIEIQGISYFFSALSE